MEISCKTETYGQESLAPKLHVLTLSLQKLPVCVCVCVCVCVSVCGICVPPRPSLVGATLHGEKAVPLGSVSLVLGTALHAVGTENSSRTESR